MQTIVSVRAEPTAEADRGRHPGFSSFNVLAGGPGSFLAVTTAEDAGKKLSKDQGLAVFSRAKARTEKCSSASRAKRP